MNRSRRENFEARLLKKHGAKSSWYKKKGGENKDEVRDVKGRRRIKRKKVNEVEDQVEAVLFVPATPDGELAKKVQEADDKMREETGQRSVKVVESGG